MIIKSVAQKIGIPLLVLGILYLHCIWLFVGYVLQLSTLYWW